MGSAVSDQLTGNPLTRIVAPADRIIAAFHTCDQANAATWGAPRSKRLRALHRPKHTILGLTDRSLNAHEPL